MNLPENKILETLKALASYRYDTDDEYDDVEWNKNVKCEDDDDDDLFDEDEEDEDDDEWDDDEENE